MNVMIVTNSGYLKTTIVMLYSLFLNQPGKIDVYMPYEDMREEEIEGLTRFVSCWEGKRLVPLYVGTDFKKAVESRNGIQVETYYRIIGWDILPPEVERILYLDVDMIVQKPLDGLYRLELGDKLFAVCEDIFGKINGFHEANKRRLGIPLECNYFNAGMMLVNVKELRRTGEVSKILDRVYQDYERYEYNDQDVLNEMYQDRLIYIGWDQYNCPPAWYYLDKQSAQEGKLVFADYNEIRSCQNDSDRFLSKYTNLTEQLAKQACIVHYLADTKPWNRDRREGRVYEYFDKCYYDVELDALRTYEQAGGCKAPEASTPILFYYGVRYCYNILNYLLKQFEDALKRRGVRTIAYDEQEEDVGGLSRFWGKRFRAIIGVQSYLFSVFLKESGQYLHDQIYAPKFNFVFDHPIWLREQLEHAPADCFVLTHDANYQEFIQEYYPRLSGSVLFPLAAEENPSAKPYADREHGVVFIGTYGDYRTKCRQILECRPQIRHLAAAYLHMMRKQPDLTAEHALKQTLEERGIYMEKEEFLDVFFQLKPVIQAIMYYYREKTIKSLLQAGIAVEIWGETWRKAPFADHELLTVHEDVTPEEGLEIMGNSRIALNIMAWHKGGFTERMAGCMRAGAVLVTDKTTYEDDAFVNDQNVILFDLNDIGQLPEKIKRLLRDTGYAESIASAGKQYADTYHSWDKRAEDFCDLLHQLGG